MIDTVLNLLFRCSHHRLTRPMAPITKAGSPHSQRYVVCLDCGKQFEYDLTQMRIGKPIDVSHEHAVVPPRQASRGKKVTLGLLAAIPVVMMLRAAWTGNNSSPPGEAPKPAAPEERGPLEG